VQTETFGSKVDTWLVLILGVSALLAIFGIGAVVRTGEMSFVAAIATVLVAAGIPLWIFATTQYVLSKESLVVRSGPFRWSIPLAEIKSVTPTRNPLSSPALSLDRLRIEYGQGRAVMISPSDKTAFLRVLEAHQRAAV
jgi:membrane protein YdbS with pleckstrin-like domain